MRALLSQDEGTKDIPRLAAVPADKFGMAVVTLDHRLFQTRDADDLLFMQRLSTAYTLTMAL